MRIFLLAVIAACAVGGAAYHYGYYPFTSPLLAACEEAMKERLKAPSTYRRISVSETKEPLSFEQYYAARPESDAVKTVLIRGATEKPVKRTILIEYDAANAFGTPLRSRSLCTFEASDSREVPLGKDFVTIDGKSYVQWLVDQLPRTPAVQSPKLSRDPKQK
jgi:hypothetical protein